MIIVPPENTVTFDWMTYECRVYEWCAWFFFYFRHTSRHRYAEIVFTECMILLFFNYNFVRNFMCSWKTWQLDWPRLLNSPSIYQFYFSIIHLLILWMRNSFCWSSRMCFLFKIVMLNVVCCVIDGVQLNKWHGVLHIISFSLVLVRKWQRDLSKHLF